MYYEKRKNHSFAIALILIFLIVIIVILISLVNRVDNSFYDKNLQPVGTDTVLTEFNIQDLAKNAGYSIVRCFKNE